MYAADIVKHKLNPELTIIICAGKILKENFEIFIAIKLLIENLTKLCF